MMQWPVIKTKLPDCDYRIKLQEIPGICGKPEEICGKLMIPRLCKMVLEYEYCPEGWR